MRWSAPSTRSSAGHRHPPIALGRDRRDGDSVSVLRRSTLGCVERSTPRAAARERGELRITMGDNPPNTRGRERLNAPVFVLLASRSKCFALAAISITSDAQTVCT